jgi:hypothetical protein
MIGVLKTILGSGDVIKKGMDLIDSMHTSDEESIKATTKAKTDLLSAYAPFKLAQRILAIMFAAVFLLCFLAAFIAVLVAWYNGTLVQAMANGEVQLVLVQAMVSLMGSFKLQWIMGTIVLFYFGGGAFEGFQQKRIEKEVARQERKKLEKGGR